MNKTKPVFFLIAAFLVLEINTANAQDNIVFPLTAKSIFQGKGIIFPNVVLTTGDSCAVLNTEKHDGPMHANGYGWLSDSGRFVIKFSPPTVGHSYPWMYTKVCIGFNGLGGTPTNVPYNIIVYDSTEYEPGNLLYCGPTRTAASVPPFPVTTWFSSPDTFVVTHAVYVGIRIRLSTSPYTLIAADEDTATPIWPAYTSTTSPPSPWQTIHPGPPIFGGYRCLAIRTEGQPATPPLQPLCEGFTSPTFPPSGWTNSNPTLIYRELIGVHGFVYCDFWNVLQGVTGDLSTITFIPSMAGDSLQFNIAHCPFGAPDEIDILTSTNGGATYATLFNMSSAYMQTTTGCTRPFMPSSSSQWGRRGFIVSAGTNKIRFHAISGYGDGACLDSICVKHPLGITNNRNEIPKVYSLSQNYPNPFNPTTLINYTIPKAGYVELKVYAPEIDILTSTNGGTAFATLFNMSSPYMQTTTDCTHPFIPSSPGQWGRRGFPVPVGTNKIRFYAIGGYGDGVYLDSVCVGHPVGISNNEKELPKVYSLFQNYPNPFNPTTLINYTIPKAGYVELKVYNVLGEEVKSLVNEFKQAGVYEVEFDGTNFSSGVYFYKIQFGDASTPLSITKRMVLIK